MALGYYKVLIQLPFTSGLPEDVAQNTIFFGCTNAGSSHDEDADDLLPYLASVFNDVLTGATLALDELIGDQVTRDANGCDLVFYFDDGDPTTGLWGSPVAMRSFTMGASGTGNPLPAEVSLALSFHGDLTNVPETAPNPDGPVPPTIRPAARRRGRIYIGPLMAIAGTTGASNDLVPTSAAKNTWSAVGAHLIDNVPSGFVWDIVSKAGGEVHVVTGGYVDDAFDTQRRRGSAPTSRLTFGTP